MFLPGFLKASDLTPSLRKALGAADFVYLFAANRNPAMFFCETRVSRFKTTGVDTGGLSIRLLRASDVTGYGIGWSKKQLASYAPLCGMVIDCSDQGRKNVEVYREDKVQRLEDLKDDLQAIKRLRMEAAERARLDKLEVLRLQRCKAESVQRFALRFAHLERLATPHFELLSESHMRSGDVRIKRIKHGEALVRHVADQLSAPIAKGGKFHYRFKSVDALECFLEEFNSVFDQQFPTSA